MTLTDTRIRTAKPRATAYKLSDGGGMYLLVTPDGARYWRMDYRFAGKRRTLALGVYPVVTLSSARTQREQARLLLAQGADPSAAKKNVNCRPANRAIAADAGPDYLNQRVQDWSPCAPTNYSNLSRDFLGLRQKLPIARYPRGRFVFECSRIPLMPPF